MLFSERLRILLDELRIHRTILSVEHSKDRAEQSLVYAIRLLEHMERVEDEWSI